MTSQDTGKFRTNLKDQYYTKASIANHCVGMILSKIPVTTSFQWIEPSAGAGVFLNQVPSTIETVGMDLDPKDPRILKGDFFAWSPTTDKQRIFFGNPPFGRQGSLAKKFIQQAALFGSVIAFILPRSFVKPSMSRAFPPTFHCIHTEELPKDSFEVNGKAYDVPCVFQIWEKRAEARPKEAAIEPIGFTYVKQTEVFDFAVKRAGGLAGKGVIGEAKDLNPQYHYYIRLTNKKDREAILNSLNAHVFPSNTVGPRSLSKSEINEVLNAIVASTG